MRVIVEVLKKGRAFLLLFFTFFLWGSVYVGGKMVSEIPAPLVACLRCCIASFPLLWMARPYRNIQIAREDWKYFFIVGMLGYFITIFLVQQGISLTGASTAALINAMTPISVTIFACILLREALTPTKIICLILAILGAVVITSDSGGQRETLGIILVLLSVLAWGIASVYMRMLTSKYPPILVTAYGTLLGLIFHIPVGIVTAVNAEELPFSLKNILVLLYLGLIGSGLAQFTWTASLSIIPASICSLFYPLQSIFAAMLGALLLHETFRPSFLIGLLLISADIILSTREIIKQQNA